MKKMKNIVCVLLAIAMCLGLTACGSGGADKAAAPSGGSTPEPSAAPEFTYVSEFEKLIENSDNFIDIRFREHVFQKECHQGYPPAVFADAFDSSA